MESLSLALLGASLVGSTVLLVRQGLAKASFRGPDCLPYSKKKFFFSAPERSFCEILRRITPGHTVFANVRLCDVMALPRGNHNRSKSKALDFLICDATLGPVLAIQLDHSSHASATRQDRDEFVDTALAAAAVPIVRIPIKRSYVLDDIRRLVFPHLSGPGPLC